MKTTIILAILVILLSVLAHGCIKWIAAGIFFPWALYSFIRIIKRPAERRNRSIRLAIWMTTIAILYAVAGHWDSVTRHEANSVASAVVEFRNRTGSYPRSLSEVGMDAQSLRDDYRVGYYVSDKGKPSLFYFQPSMPLLVYHYDFERSKWFLRG